MKRAGSLRFWAATVILILAAALSVAGTVMSRTGFDRAELEGYYGGLEERLVKDTRERLQERGFLYSGVMLTRVVNGDGSREYTISVHHRDIRRMTKQEREELALSLKELVFEDERCGFRYEFIFADD